jgi:hypothetical protein
MARDAICGGLLIRLQYYPDWVGLRPCCVCVLGRSAASKDYKSELARGGEVGAMRWRNGSQGQLALRVSHYAGTSLKTPAIFSVGTSFWL